MKRTLPLLFAALLMVGTAGLAVATTRSSDGGGNEGATAGGVASAQTGMSWEDAKASGHPAVADFVKPEDMPYCQPTRWPDLAAGENPPDDGPECFMRPEELGLVFVPPGQSTIDYPVDVRNFR